MQFLEYAFENQINLYAPQVELNNVTVDKSPNSHELYVGIFYRVRVNEEEDAIQINFSPDSDTGGMHTTGTSYPIAGGGSSVGASSGGSSGGGGGGGGY